MSFSLLQSLKKLATLGFINSKSDLHWRLSLTFVSLVLILTFGLLLIAENRQRASIVHQMQARIKTIASHLAAVGTKALLTYNFVTLQQDADETAQAQDVLYTIVLDRDGRVAAYSGHSEKQGTVLQDPFSQRAAQTHASLLQYISASQDTGINEEHYEIAIPVVVPGRSEKWGTVRVGLSLQAVNAEIQANRLPILFWGGLGIVIAVLMAFFIARQEKRRFSNVTRQVEASGMEEPLASQEPSSLYEQVIIRTIEFPPEYQQAGIGILNHFAHIVRRKYPYEDITVKIEQCDLTVRLIVQTKEGIKEEIEKTLTEYGLVVTGKMPLEEFSSDPFEILELRNELRIADIRLRWDSWASVMYAEAPNSATSSVTLQSTDRHGILGEKPADFQVSL